MMLVPKVLQAIPRHARQLEAAGRIGISTSRRLLLLFMLQTVGINFTSHLSWFICSHHPSVVILTLHHGPKPAIMIAGILTLVGNWVRYAGTRAGSHGYFGVVMFGQILIGLGQPFVLAAPTRYSDLWFTERGRISATALASLANPFGGALGQLIDPFWATKPSEVPNMVLYTAIIVRNSLPTTPTSN